MRNMLLAMMLIGRAAAAADLDAVADFGANPGALDMFEHVPADLPAHRPLVVVLHGCTQTAAAIEVAGWNALADARGFAVLYPQQRSANQSLSCFSWYSPADIARGGGEAASIVAMVDDLVAMHAVDPARVYVTGLSAGGAFTTVMLAAYPDRFAAGSVMAGLPYACATDLASTSKCQQAMVDHTPAAWGDLVRGASDWQGPWPRVQIFQGASDYTVYPANAKAIAAQWTDVHGADQTVDATETIGAATHEEYRDASGAVVVDSYTIAGMGHAIVTGMDPAEGACPAGSGAYFEDHGICSTLRAARFFGLMDGDGGGSGGSGSSGSGSDPGSSGGDRESLGCNAGGAAGWLVCWLVPTRRKRRLLARAHSGRAARPLHRAGAMRMLVLLSILLVATAARAASTTLAPVASFGANPGALKMYEYVPSGLAAHRPLVVVMHGCTQAAQAMTTAGWNALADQYQFAVLYPEQESGNNPVECFNWAGEYGDTADLQRGQGENQSVMSMIDTEVSAHAIDSTKVYIVGFSAGAAFTAVMLATWPERFAAGAILEGVPYRCATSVSGAYSCQSPGVTKTAAAWGDLVRAASSATAFPRVQVWSGTSDTTVVPANAAELVKQWTNVHGADQTADETETIGGTTRTGYKDAGGTLVVEAFSVQGMDHAVAVGTDALGACPGTTAQYFEDKGICSTLRAAKFFGLLGGSTTPPPGDDTTPPVVAFESPTDGAVIAPGATTIVVAASDAGGVASVDLAIDGAAVGTSTTAPFQFAWTAAVGSHALVATAHDAAGNMATATMTVRVDVDAPAGSGSGSGSGSAGETGAGGDRLPGCSLDVTGGRGGGGGLVVFGIVALGLARSGRRARRSSV